MGPGIYHTDKDSNAHFPNHLENKFIFQWFFMHTYIFFRIYVLPKEYFYPKYMIFNAAKSRKGFN